MKNAKENIETLNDFGNTGYQNMRDLGEINLKVWEKMMEKSLENAKFWTDTGVRQMELMLGAKDFKQMMENQVALTKEVGERLVEQSYAGLQITQDTGDEYRAWFEKSVDTVAEKVSNVAQKAA
jgi:hypothetical protein